jgi:hypothetical protein
LKVGFVRGQEGRLATAKVKVKVAKGKGDFTWPSNKRPTANHRHSRTATQRLGDVSHTAATACSHMPAKMVTATKRMEEMMMRVGGIRTRKRAETRTSE